MWSVFNSSFYLSVLNKATCGHALFHASTEQQTFIKQVVGKEIYQLGMESPCFLVIAQKSLQLEEHVFSLRVTNTKLWNVPESHQRKHTQLQECILISLLSLTHTQRLSTGHLLARFCLTDRAQRLQTHTLHRE